MCSKECFVDRFRDEETEELLHRYATAEITEEAKAAILLLLAERGIDTSTMAPLVDDRGADELSGLVRFGLYAVEQARAHLLPLLRPHRAARSSHPRSCSRPRGSSLRRNAITYGAGN